MSSVSYDHRELAAALGTHGFRVRGVVDSACVNSLGLANLRRLVELLGESANAFLAAGAESRDDLQRAMIARTAIEEIASHGGTEKPVLPRLRAEFFRPGDSVAVYVGDTQNLMSPTEWVLGEVTTVSKSHKAEWSSDVATRGFYWRVAAKLVIPELRAPRVLYFSTTEPRVLPIQDFRALRLAFENDLRFLAVFVENAVRDWPPIWMIESGDTTPIRDVPYARWLLRGTCHAELLAAAGP